MLKLAVQFFNEKRGGINVGEQLPLQMWRGEPSRSVIVHVWAGVEPSSCIGGRRFALSITTLDDESKAPKVRFARRGGVSGVLAPVSTKPARSTVHSCCGLGSGLSGP